MVLRKIDRSLRRVEGEFSLVHRIDVEVFGRHSFNLLSFIHLGVPCVATRSDCGA
ncbi:MAG: hypothetical protein AW08_00949 [Candidatus Accumulibacter adjunctus]|uniref:Uncharacterized protein n=1 Tax=Candidatus Accumulibacter adjunctus TaxID=1454001 RepID=A0A011NVL7_9PROT|nr:MAG: hypothetical protein AW08_00949 [Candidatus Accumulibacter adjunctus]